MKIQGRGKFEIFFLPYSCNNSHHNEIYSIVYVPFLTYNYIPHQILIANIHNKDNMVVYYKKHYDT